MGQVQSQRVPHVIADKYDDTSAMTKEPFDSVVDVRNAERSVPTEDAFNSALGLHWIKLQTLVIGGALHPRRDMTTWCNTLEDFGWVNRFRLQVFREDPHVNASIVRVHVGEAWRPHRITVSFNEEDARSRGWNPKLSFYAFRNAPAEGKYVMIAVGEASGPYRCKFEIGRHIGTKPGDEGWWERCVFWVPAQCIQ